MFDYSNLSDTEFEKLCCDVLQRKLNANLRYFSPGRDGGIDLVDNLYEKNIIVQVKHYDKSSYSSLKSSLQKELKKLEELKPKAYYICTSQTLTPANISEIYSIFKQYMLNDKNIITRNELDEFLQDGNNKDILRKNFKLWLTADTVLTDLLNENVFLDGEVLLSDIEQDFKYFVQTKLFDECIEILEKERRLLLYGDPGVGKTLNSKMLALYFVKRGYRIRYTTNGDIDDFKRSLTSNKDVKEVIFLDDCLGQYYFKLKENQDKEIVSLIKHVGLYEHKVIILNSRITIFNEAKNRSEDFKKYFESEKINIRKINMSAVSAAEKALIFYNHLLKNRVPNEYYNVVRKDKKYMRIVAHNNYNPRIIDYVTTPFRYNLVEKENYFQYIIRNLDNPQDVWRNEFDMRLTNVDRLFINTLFSLTDTVVEISVLKECFLERIKKETIDSTINIFDYTLNRLTKSLIKIVDNKSQKMIGVLNPSINDYLKNEIWNNELEMRKIRESIVYIEQIEKCYRKEEVDELLLKLVQSGQILKFKSRKDDDRVIKLLLCVIAKNKIVKEEYRNVAFRLGTLNNYTWFGGVTFSKHSIVYTFLREEKLFNFYGIESLLKDKKFIRSLLNEVDLKYSVVVINELIEIFSGREEFESYYADLFKEELRYSIETYIETLDYYDIIDFDWAQDYDALLQNAITKISIKADEIIEDALENVKKLDVHDIDYNIHIDEDLVEELIKEELRGDYDSDNHERYVDYAPSDVDIILDRDINY